MKPAIPAMMRWLVVILFPHSQLPPSHFPVVMSVLTDSMQGQVLMNVWIIPNSNFQLEKPGLGGTRTHNQRLKRALLYH